MPLAALLLGASAGPGPEDPESPELAADQIRNEALLEVKFARFKQQYGVGDRRTLDVFFELFDLWIQLYRLNKADDALSEIVPAAEWRRDSYAVRAVQALAFTRWKQSRFREALERFHEMEGLVGKGRALCENIGHTYNSLGSYELAEQYFNEAVALTVDKTPGSQGTVLLGLATLQSRRGDATAALATATRSYEDFRAQDARRGWESSLTAKALMQVSTSHQALANYKKSEWAAREALRVFQFTAGMDSPLCVGPLERLGALHALQGRMKKAQTSYHDAYKVASIKDALDLVEILGIHNALVDIHYEQMKTSGLDRKAFSMYFAVASHVAKRVRTEMVQDGNAAVYYKTAGELFVLGGDCSRGQPLLEEARGLLLVETAVDTTSLVKACSDLISFCGSGAGVAARDGPSPSAGTAHDEF